MVAPLATQDKIPELAQKVGPAELKMLHRLKAVGGSILNGKDVDVATAKTLEQLANDLLVDVGYADHSNNQPYVWTLNGNGERVLQHIEAERPQRIAEEQERKDAERVKGAKWLP